MANMSWTADAHATTMNRCPPRGARSSRLYRGIAGVVFVILWLVAGYIVKATIPGFLVLGVAAYAIFHVAVRKFPVHTLLVRDSEFFGRAWKRNVCVAASFVLVPALMTLQSLSSGHWIDNSWAVLLIVTTLLAAYVALRRLLASVLVAALVVISASWMLAPQLATARHGDPQLLSLAATEEASGGLAGYHDLLLAEVDSHAEEPVRLASLGAVAGTPMEIGSITKAMTGLVIADAVERGEVQLSSPVSTYLPSSLGHPPGSCRCRS